MSKQCATGIEGRVMSQNGHITMDYVLHDAIQRVRNGRSTHQNRYNLSDLITVTLQEQWDQILRPALQRNIYEGSYRCGIEIDFHDKGPGGARNRSERSRRIDYRSEEHTTELQSRGHLVCRLLLEKK